MSAPGAFGRFYDGLFLFVPFFPPVIAAVAAPIARRARNWRWIVHSLAFVTMLLSMPLYLLGLPVFSPISAEYPGAGDGFIVLFWMFVLGLTLIGYALHVWFSYRDTKSVNQPSS